MPLSPYSFINLTHAGEEKHVFMESTSPENFLLGRIDHEKCEGEMPLPFGLKWDHCINVNAI